jgi:hypothetical protein
LVEFIEAQAKHARCDFDHGPGQPFAVQINAQWLWYRIRRLLVNWLYSLAESGVEGSRLAIVARRNNRLAFDNQAKNARGTAKTFEMSYFLSHPL